MFPRISQGHPTTSLGNLCQCFTTLIVTVSSYTLSETLILKPFPLVLLLQALLKSLSPFCDPPLSIKGHGKVSLEPSFLQAEQSQLSACLHGRGVSALSSSLASPGLSPAGPYFHVGDPRAGGSTAGGVSPEWGKIPFLPPRIL